jgi:hypothetical protein
MESIELSQENSSSTFRVVDVVMGGGYQLRPGMVLSEEDLGELAQTLLECGAIECCKKTQATAA